VFWLNLAMLLFWQTQVVEVRHPDASDLAVLLPPPCPPQACPAPFYAPMPVGMPLPSQMKAYRVEVRFTGGPKDEMPPLKTCVMVREKMPAAMASVAWRTGGQSRHATISTAVKEAHADRVVLDLNVVCSGAKPCCCKCVETVHLNTKKEVVFKGDCPEPCCAEVTVTEVIEPPAPLAVAACPPGLPCPTSPITQCAGTAPVCCPPQVVCPSPVCCPLPPGYTVAQPIPCLPPTPVQLCHAQAMAKPLRTTHLSIVRNGEKACVKMTCGDSCVTSARMTVEGGEAGALTIAAGKKHVHVTGKAWKAQADAIDVRDDGTVTLRGHVVVTSDRIGQGASVKADELCVKVTRGAFDKVVGKGVQTQVHDQPRIYYTTPTAVMPVSTHAGPR
jgi:hypothetical protein